MLDEADYAFDEATMGVIDEPDEQTLFMSEPAPEAGAIAVDEGDYAFAAG